MIVIVFQVLKVLETYSFVAAGICITVPIFLIMHDLLLGYLGYEGISYIYA
jgi:hypothetical protein